MLRVALMAGSLALGACASTRAIEVEIDNQLGAPPATLVVFEVFRNFPMVSGHTTAQWEAPSGLSLHRIEACLPLHINGPGGLQLSEANADGEAASTLRYRIQLQPKPEAGALRQPKQAGALGVLYFDYPPTAADSPGEAANAARFNRAVEEAGSRASLGCWGGPIFEAMERADP